MENNTILKDEQFNDIISYIYNEYKDWYVDADFIGELASDKAIERVEKIIDMFLTEIWVGVSGQYIYDVDASYLLEDILEGAAEYYKEKGLVADEWDDDDDGE